MKRLFFLSAIAFVMVVAFGFSAYAAPVGQVRNLQGQAKVFHNQDPSNWEMVTIGMSIDERDVIQVGPNSRVLVVINGVEGTLQARSTTQIAQIAAGGASAQPDVDRPVRSDRPSRCLDRAARRPPACRLV